MEKPYFIKALEKNDPELLKHLSSIQQLTDKDGALTMKVKVLMSMLGDAILGHPEGVKAIAQRAREMGVTEQEIAETVRVAFLCGGLPALVTGTQAFPK